MTKVFEKFTEQVRHKLSPRTIRLVPGEYFYCHAVDLPPGIKAQDISQFSEFSLEGLSPFTIEQLAWGVLYDPTSPHILIYAAYRSRLRKENIVDLETYYHVFPSFITAVGQVYEQPTISFLCHDTSLSALFYSPYNRLPEKIISTPLPPSRPEDTVILKARQELLKSICHNHYEVDEGVRVVTIKEVDSDDTISFTCHYVKEGEPQLQANSMPLPLDETSLWYSDIRDSAYIQRKRKERNLSQKIWKSIVAAGLAAALLILLQLSFFIMGIWIESREKTIQAQSEEVLRIEGNFDLLQKVEQFAQQELKPFEMLEATNLKRPETVYFTKTYAENFNHLKIEGLGSDVEAVNRYTEQLRQTPSILNVEPRVLSRGGKAPFTLNITFKGPPYEPDKVVAEAQRLP